MYLLYDLLNAVIVQNDLNSLTTERIQEAIVAIKNHQPTTDATFNTLLRHYVRLEPTSLIHLHIKFRCERN